MSEVYSSPDSYADPPSGANPMGEPGVLIDGTPCVVIASHDTAIDHRTHGYDQGLWTHDLALSATDGRFYITSTHILTGRRREVRALDVIDWKRQVPGE